MTLIRFDTDRESVAQIADEILSIFNFAPDLGYALLLLEVHNACICPYAQDWRHYVSHILRSSYGIRHCQVEPWHNRWQGAPFSAEDLQQLRRLYPNLKSIAGHRIMAYPDLAGQWHGVQVFHFYARPPQAVRLPFSI